VYSEACDRDNRQYSCCHTIFLLFLIDLFGSEMSPRSLRFVQLLPDERHLMNHGSPTRMQLLRRLFGELPGALNSASVPALDWFLTMQATKCGGKCHPK
jgi:hypothetical protein